MRAVATLPLPSQAAEQYVSRLLSTQRKCGVPHELRSSTDVDSDLCFMATAEYYLPSVGGALLGGKSRHSPILGRPILGCSSAPPASARHARNGLHT